MNPVWLGRPAGSAGRGRLGRGLDSDLTRGMVPRPCPGPIERGELGRRAAGPEYSAGSKYPAGIKY
jgi:hypothetical protein